MAGVWPNLDAADLETRVRTYLNEVSADFYTQAEIWRWLSVAVKDISQKTTCIRRILDAQTTSATRTVSVNAYKTFHVEYIPASGRSLMLTKIDPTRVGHFPLNGTAPQYWYEFGATIGIDPLPDATYELRLYVSDIPKMVAATYSTFASGWTAGTGWTASTAASHTGASSGDITSTTALVASTNYTFEFTVTSMGVGGSVTPYAGTTAGIPVTTNGYHTQNIISSAGTIYPKFTAVNAMSITALTLYKEADYAAVGDQTELPTMWQHLLALYATQSGLVKAKRYGASQMLESLYKNELAYLRQSMVETIPQGKNDQKYK